MADEAHVQWIDELRWHLRLKGRLSRNSGRSLADEPESDRDAVHVGVDGEVRAVEREEKHARRRLGTDAGQREEQVPEVLVAAIAKRTGLVDRDALLA